MFHAQGRQSAERDMISEENDTHTCWQQDTNTHTYIYTHVASKTQTHIHIHTHARRATHYKALKEGKKRANDTLLIVTDL